MAEEQTQVQDPPVTPDPTVAGSAAPAAPTPATSGTPGNTPWTQDINAIFEDDGIRTQVDQYLREKVQPYTTQLEQKAAQAEQALNLWQSFEKDPATTYVQITKELYGDEAAQQVLDALQAQLGQQEQQEPQANVTSVDPRMEEALNWYEAQQANSYYEQEFERIKNEPQNADILPFLDDIHSFVAVEGGFDEAAQSLRRFVQKYGVPQQTQETPTPEPPAVLGSDTSTAQASSLPVEPRKQSLDDAINEFMAENRKEPAPPVM